MAALLAGLALLAMLVAAPATRRRWGLPSADGTKIVLSFFSVIGTKAGERTPTVLVGHGYGRGRETTGTSDSEMLVGQTPDIAWHSLITSLYKEATFKDG